MFSCPFDVRATCNIRCKVDAKSANLNYILRRLATTSCNAELKCSHVQCRTLLPLAGPCREATVTCECIIAYYNDWHTMRDVGFILASSGPFPWRRWAVRAKALVVIHTGRPLASFHLIRGVYPPIFREQILPSSNPSPPSLSLPPFPSPILHSLYPSPSSSPCPLAFPLSHHPPFVLSLSFPQIHLGVWGALWAPTAGSGAEPQPKLNLMHFNF